MSKRRPPSLFEALIVGTFFGVLACIFLGFTAQAVDNMVNLDLSELAK